MILGKSLKIFLSGGLADWQDTVIDALQDQDVRIFDPREINSENELHYSYYNLHNATNADILFAYMSTDNPSGYGMSFEVGAAIASKVPVILVLDFDQTTHLQTKDMYSRALLLKNHFKMHEELADIVCYSLNEGIEQLLKAIKLGED